MEAKRYRRLCRLVDQLSPHGRHDRQQFSDRTIVKVYFWSTRCDRPVSWACRWENWPERLLQQAVGLTLPSQPTMSRRMRTVGVLQLIERVQIKLAQDLGQQRVKVIDSKPLKVGSYSKDREARRGRAAGESARGYKLHAITSGDSFCLWTLTGMNVNDQVGAALLLPKLTGWGYITADNGYDANAVHRQARAANHRLIAPPRPSNAHVRDVKRNEPERIRSLDLFANPLQHCGLADGFGRYLINARAPIERHFGNATMQGLSAPPPWVRTPHRVAAWTGAKLIQTMQRKLEIAGVMT